MDQLIQHCLRELSFDGDLGCSAARLKDCIINFHDQGAPQTVDDAYCAFVWGIMAQSSTVHVGVIPDNLAGDADVAIAPQPSKNRNAKGPAAAAPGLELIEDGKTRSFRELIQQHGDNLRIAADPETTFAAITGSHHRPAALTPMVYTVLQLITRGREHGTSTVTIGRTTGYDQKTVFYLVSKLVGLDLVLKLRKPGTAMYFCVHRYFYEQSDYWKDIRKEESRAQSAGATSSKKAAENESEGDSDNDDESGFKPLDRRHLTSIAIVRARILKLLNRCANGMHVARNLITAVGFVNPVKSDRRLFATHVRSITEEGLVEVIEVPHTKSKGSGWVKCIRLIPETGKVGSADQPDGSTQKANKVVQSADISDEDLEESSERLDSGLQANRTLQYQIVTALEDAGPGGLRLTDLEELLGGTDRRTLELALIRLESAPLPSELAHKAISHAIETSGRERRYRYYMRSLYTATFPQDHTYVPLDESQAGTLGTLDFALFWDHEREVHRFVDGIKGGDPIEDEDEDGDTKPSKSRRIKKGRVNPVLPDGKVKLGRPRKNSGELKRPRKKPRKESVVIDEKTSAASGIEHGATVPAQPQLSSTKRGTKRKAAKDSAEATVSTPVTKKRRTRRAPQGIPEDSPDIAAAAFPVQISPPTLNIPSAGVAMPNLDSNVSSPLTELSSDPLSRPPSPPPESSLQVSQAVEILPEVAPELDPDCSIAVTDTHPPVSPARKAPVRAAKPKGPKTNVSHLLREKEFMVLLQDNGGILSINVKDFGDAHSALIQRLHASGEPASCAPDVIPDKRTVLATFAKMESKGMVKTVKTITKTALGVQRPIMIGYVADLPTDALNEFLANVGRNPVKSQAVALKKVDDAMLYDEVNGTRPSLPLQLLSLHDPGDREERWMKNENRADQLFGYDDDTIRDVLLSETTTLAQSYGYLVPKAMRCRQLHLLATQAFESEFLPPSIVSREHRILNLSFFHEDLAVQDYCSLVSVLTKSDQLAQLLQNQDGKRTTLTNLPIGLYNEMQINRPRGRCRILSILETLRSLNLVVPLRPSTTINPWIQCARSDKYPNAFDRAPLSGWSSSTPSEAPLYWRFSTTAPVHLWSLHLSDPPFWKDMSVTTVRDCIEYWAALKQVSINTDVARGIRSPSSGSLTGPLQSTSEGVACLNRMVSWKDNYILTWHQERFIKRIVTDETWKMDNEETREAKIARICRVTTANRQAVEMYIPRAIDQHAKSQARQPRKPKTEDEIERLRAAKATVQQRASRAKAARLEEWKTLVQKVHPEEVPRALALRLARVRNGFMSAMTTQGQEWEASISQAIRDYHMASGLAVVLPSTSVQHVTSRGPITQIRPPAFENRKSVQTIIDEMGPPIGDHVVHKSKKKKKRKGKAGSDQISSDDEPGNNGLTSSGTPRMRRRWAWTAEHEDLAKDAYVVIKARVRRLKARLDWAPLEHVFPAIPRNSVRQRLGRWLEDSQVVSYLGRLEAAWLELWHQYCGTDHLSDPYPESTLDWPIIAHIEFLRKHIDKRVVRAGYTHPEPDETFNLPKTVEDTLAMFDVIEDRPAEPLFNHITNTQVDEGRERHFNAIAFSTVPERAPDPLEYSDDHQCVAESALKIVFGTPKAYYDADQAAMILRSLGEELVAVTRVNLLARGVMSRQIKLGKHGPGRTLKIAEANQDLLGGPVGEQVFHDAADFMDALDREFGAGMGSAAGRAVDEWALEAPDGDMAALLELVSQYQVQFTVGTSGPQTHRRTLEYQSKKVVDDQIETVIQYTVDLPKSSHLAAGTSVRPDTTTTTLIPFSITPFLPHGTRKDGRPACCGLQVAGIVDCEACVSRDTQTILVSSPQLDRADLEGIMNAVIARAEGGLPMLEISNIGLEQPDRAEDYVRMILELKAPPFVRVGYKEDLLVSVCFLDHWTVPVSAESPARALPRRWLDIWGEQVPNLRTLATQAVLGVVALHPGITQGEVLWRLRHVYDRPEVEEVIRGLCVDNRLTQRQAWVDSAGAFERHRFLFINGLGRWFWRN